MEIEVITMKEQSGKIIEFAKENRPVAGCSISKQIYYKDSIYTEVEFRKEGTMNEILKAGEVFQLAELLPYQEGKIVNMDLVSNDKMKFVIMSFDAGTGLSEHAAPGEALVFALDGEAVIGYEGKEYTIHAGETFKFDKLGKHSVSATKQFKMALLLVLE